MQGSYYRPRKKTKRRRLSKLASRKSYFRVWSPKLALFLVLVLLLIGFSVYVYLGYKIEGLKREKEDLVLTNARLSAKISRLEKDPKAYEEIARKKYGLVKDNERLVIFR